MQIEQIRYKGFGEAFRLSNGVAEAVVVARIGGRVMHYGLQRGPNLLWENPAEGSEKPLSASEWRNWGGDKMWPWPQDDWGARQPNTWPPPVAIDQAPYQVERTPAGALRLTSTIIAGWGMRAVRELRLEPRSTRLSIVNRLEKIRDGAAFPVGAWTITQVPPEPSIWCRPLGGGTGNVKQMMETPVSSTPTRSGLVQVSRVPDRSFKVGLDADALAVATRGALLLVRRRSGGEGSVGASEAAQIYGNPPDTAYLELEFTGGVRVLKKGEAATLETSFEAEPLPAGLSEGEIPARVLQLLREQP